MAIFGDTEHPSINIDYKTIHSSPWRDAHSGPSLMLAGQMYGEWGNVYRFVLQDISGRIHSQETMVMACTAGMDDWINRRYYD